MRTLLIATTNEGKAKEIASMLADLHFGIISLQELSDVPPAPEETAGTLEGNALLKARYYAEKTGHMTLADDTGLFIEALQDWPGVHAARIAPTSTERCQQVLEKMKGIDNRNAAFRNVMAIYDPRYNTTFISEGDMPLEVATEMPTSLKHGFGYDAIVYATEQQKKLVNDMTTQEKNAISHRGKALIKVKRFLNNQYRGKHFVVPISLIVKKRKILMNRRNDPHNADYHGIWEFPGGAVEMGESLETAVIKECREETGFAVAIVAQLPYIKTKSFSYDSGDCQFYIVPFVCKITGGSLAPNAEEVLESDWKTFDEMLALKKFPGDTELMTELRDQIETIIEQHNL